MVLWAVNLFTYLFITISSFSFDPKTGKRVWREGICFPGLISLSIIIWAAYPPILSATGLNESSTGLSVFLLFIYSWLALSMVAAWLCARLELSGRLGRLVPPLFYIVGYGPLLTAMTAAAYIKELQGAEMKWDKTEKTGQIGELT